METNKQTQTNNPKRFIALQKYNVLGALQSQITEGTWLPLVVYH